MASSSRSSPMGGPTLSHSWYEDAESKLALGHPFLDRTTEYIKEGISITPPDLYHRPHQPPPNTTTFFVGRFVRDLRLPIPSLYFNILSFFCIPVNQLAPNSIRIIVGTIIIFQHLNIPLSPQLFHCLYQLKMVEPNVFYFKGRSVCQFLTDVIFPQRLKKFLLFCSSANFPTLWIILENGASSLT